MGWVSLGLKITKGRWMIVPVAPRFNGIAFNACKPGDFAITVYSPQNRFKKRHPHGFYIQDRCFAVLNEHKFPAYKAMMDLLRAGQSFPDDFGILVAHVADMVKQALEGTPHKGVRLVKIDRRTPPGKIKRWLQSQFPRVFTPFVPNAKVTQAHVNAFFNKQWPDIYSLMTTPTAVHNVVSVPLEKRMVIYWR